METQVKPYQRAPQVLSLLADHGQLSAKTLQTLIQPAIGIRRLNEVLQRLYEQRVIVKQYDRLFGNSAVFYHLPQNTYSHIHAAKKFNRTTEILNPPYIRHSELLHSQQCALWTENLKRLYPDQVVLREYDFLGHDEYEKYFMTSDLNSHKEQRPDVFLLLKNTQNDKGVPVAFEIELHQKSEKRLLKKLKTFTTESHAAAVVYVCAKEAILHRLIHIYKSRVMQKALRVNHYGNYFLMFTSLEQDFKSFDPLLISITGKSLKMTAWLSILSQHESAYRRNHYFEPPA